MPERNRKDNAGIVNSRSGLYGALASVAALISLGILNLWDFKPARSYYGEDPFYLVKPIIWAFIGFAVMMIIRWASVWIERYRWIFVVMALLLLIAPFVPGLECAMGGCRRYFHVSGVGVYSGLWAVTAALPALAGWLSRARQRHTRFTMGIFVVWLLLSNFLLALQPHASMVVLFGMVVLSMALISRLNMHYRIVIIATALLFPVCFAVDVTTRDYRGQFFQASYDHRLDPQGAGYQSRRSVEDIRAGGLTGQGFGSYPDGSQGSAGYVMPYTITTFALQITARWGGVVSVVYVVFLLGVLACFGVCSIKEEKSDFYRALKTGALMFLLFQAVCSIVRTTNLLPFVPSYMIPFLAYGPNSTISAFIALGFVFPARVKKPVLS